MTFQRNKTHILTGASRGIGLALGKMLAQEGVPLVLNAREAGPLDEAKAACESEGGKACAVAGDAADPKVCAAMVEQARQLGELGGFIHCAGVLAPGPNVWELEPGLFDAVLRANVVAGWQLARHVFPVLIEAGQGLAVFFGSGASEIAQPGIGVYCAAKAAEESLARQLAAEAPQITTIIYRPGIVETRMQVDARLSKGGASAQLRAVFRPWKEEGLLTSPEQAAEGLMHVLKNDPGRYHGRVADAREI